MFCARIVHSNECFQWCVSLHVQCVALYGEAQKSVTRAHSLELRELCRLKPVTGMNHLHASFIIQLFSILVNSVNNKFTAYFNVHFTNELTHFWVINYGTRGAGL